MSLANNSEPHSLIEGNYNNNEAKPKRRLRIAGFTFIEVIVAMAVFVVTAGTVFSLTSNSVFIYNIANSRYDLVVKNYERYMVMTNYVGAALPDNQEYHGKQIEFEADSRPTLIPIIVEKVISARSENAQVSMSYYEVQLQK